MKLSDLREVLQDQTVVWLEDEYGDHLRTGALMGVDPKYDNCEIKLMYARKYRLLTGIAVVIASCENACAGA